MSKRLFYLDNLKIALTFLVLTHHAAQAYGPTGGFWPFATSENDSFFWLGRFLYVNAAFFMDLFFMISGYFLAPSYSRKGIIDISKDKIIRFGIPLLFICLLIAPLIFYFYYNNYSRNPHLSYWKYFKDIFWGVSNKPEWFKPTIGWPESNFGFAHLWFVEHLLIYALFFGVIHFLFAKTLFSIKEINPYILYFLLIITITAASIIIRKQYPIDRWVDLFGFITTEPAHLPQYLALLLTGILAYKHNLFKTLNPFFCRTLVGIGLLIVFMVYFKAIMPALIINIMNNNTVLLETILCISFCFGLAGIARDHANISNRFLKKLSANSYGAYVFHFPFVIKERTKFKTILII